MYQSRVKRGFTIVEVMVVSAIVAILASIAFVVAAPMREKARQAACISNLRQIYAAVVMYSSDNQGGSVVPGSDISTKPFPYGPTLAGYVTDRRIYYCPDFPERAKSKMSSSYEWRFAAFDPAFVADDIGLYKRTLADLEAQGLENYPMMTCWTHDQIYYLPSEDDIATGFLGAFAIVLHFDGSVKSARRSRIRAYAPL